MSARITSPLLAALLLAACATTPSAPEGPERVELRFVPEPGLAQVETRRVRTIRTGADQQQQHMVTRYTSTALEVPEGIAYGAENVEVESDWGPPVLHEIGARATERISMVVSPDAEIVEIDGLDELQPALLAWWEQQPQFQQLPPQAQAQLLAVIEQISNPETIAAHAAADFFLQVGAWHGKTLEIGRRYEAQDGGYTYAATDRVPCREGEEEARCVRLQLDSRPSEEDLAQARQMMAQLFAALPAGIEPGPITMEDSFTLIAEPDGLLPWRMEKVRHMESELRADEQRDAITIEDRRTTVWSHE